MAYRIGDRAQADIFPPTIEELVSDVDPVRVYDAFVEALNPRELGIIIDDHKVGCPEYGPKAMLKLLAYGYSYGLRSSRKLERATHHNLSFIWLMAGLKPDHKTIAEFRRKNKSALRKALTLCAKLCVKLKLIEGNTLFVDGTKIRANASIGRTWTKKRCQRLLKNIDQRIESILAECESVDDNEAGVPSLVKLKKGLAEKEALKTKVLEAMKKLESDGLNSINTTDPDCATVKGRQGTHAGYNGQIVVDEKHGLIVESDVVNDANDLKQFANQIEKSNETLGKKCETACADAGYANTDVLKKIDDQGVTVIVPTTQQAHNRAPKPFGKERFNYSVENDCYVCPEGQTLVYYTYCHTKRHRIYQIKDRSLCLACAHFGLCTSSKSGRRIRRLENEAVKEKLARQYELPESQRVYALRKQKVELPFGHIKRNLGVGSFLLRGIEGARAEMALLSSCFNISRMITIIGVTALLTKLTG